MFKTLLVSLFLLVAPSATAQTVPVHQLDILKVDKNEVRPGESIVFEVLMPTPLYHEFGDLVLTDGQDFIKKQDKNNKVGRYHWLMETSEKAAGSQTLYVSGVTKYRPDGSAELLRTNTQHIIVKPDLTTLKSMVFAPAEPLVLQLGATEQLTVKGVFYDGITRDLTLADVETKYRKGKETHHGQKSTQYAPVFTVSPDGLVTAQSLGEGEVVAVNNGKVTRRRILVIEPKE